MPCYFPLNLPQTAERTEPLTVPCGRCIGCRLERSRQWAIRCMHEAQMHESNRFVTLTYRDEELIYGGNEKGILYPRHLTLFFKRLRKRFGPGLRYFACGEYGEQLGRPHYHAIIFGLNLPDEVYHTTKNGNRLNSSCMLDSIWSHGDCIIGDVSFESAAYVARYVMKKHLGKDAKYYKEHGIEPEFVRMSRGGRGKDGLGGIGKSWYQKYKSDVFPRDFVVVRQGVKCKPPKFYSNLFKKEDALKMDDISLKRFDDYVKQMADNTPARREVKHRVKKAQIKCLARNSF